MLDHVHHLIIIVSCLTSLFFELSPYFLFCRPRWEKGRHQLPRLAWNPERWQKTPHPWSHESSVATWHGYDSYSSAPATMTPGRWHKLIQVESQLVICRGMPRRNNHNQPRSTTKHQGSEGPGDSTGFQGIPRCWFQTTGIHLPEKDQSQLPGSNHCTAVD